VHQAGIREYFTEATGNITGVKNTHAYAIQYNIYITNNNDNRQ